MKKHFFAVIAPIAGIAIAVTACQKKLQTPLQPALSAPASTHWTSPAAQPIPAEIEVKASSGPVELSLALYKTKIEAGYPWFRVQLKNAGNNKIRVLNKPFTSPFVIQEKRGENNSGIYLEILNSAGEAPSENLRGASMVDPTSLPPLLTEHERATIDQWTRDGIGSEEVGRRVAELLRRNHLNDYRDPPAFWMGPGASTATAAWADSSGEHAGKPIGEFAELSNFDLPSGKYRIRAVYDLYSDPGYYKKHHIQADDWEVRVKTPFIEFEILP